MKRKSSRICGRNTTTAPTPAITPSTSRLFKSPGGRSPPMVWPSQPTPFCRASIDAALKLERNGEQLAAQYFPELALAWKAAGLLVGHGTRLIGDEFGEILSGQ